ncbi:MAG: hypothetical protein HZB46_18495, partial [Solirubrobacterales bacterium]|nr:hypothetical protein [Solirubrobacterales bacterium]
DYLPAGGQYGPVTLPHVFDGEPVKAEFGGTAGKYELRLAAPDAPEGMRWGLRFEQVRRVARVFFDGEQVATHRDPYAPFTVALPSAFQDGKEHVVTVAVDNRKGKEPREGWWNWGGITRPVALVPVGAVTAEDPGFLSRRAGGRWQVLVDTVVLNRARRTIRPTVETRVLGRRVTQAVRPLAPGEQARVRLAVDAPRGARPWSPEHPVLHQAELRVREGGRVWDLDRAKVGLRTVAVRDGLLVLNGRHVELRGASIQEDVPGRGPAMTDADVRKVVADLKAIGANVTRAHYALDERLLRALDAAGILVWSQAPIYHRDRLLETGAQRDAALSTLRATVLAARSHPSVITHSVANELSVVPDEVPGTDAYLREARRLVRDLDPTLPTSVDTLSYPGFPRQKAYAAFDMLGINSYFGWYPGKDDHSTANIRDLEPYLRSMREMYPRAGLVLTEFGAESTYHGPARTKETYAFQADYARTVLGEADRAPFLSGAIYWTLQEFAVKPDWDGGALRKGVARDAIHNKGLITYDGRPKPAYDVVKAAIARTPLLRPDADVALVTGVKLPAADRGHRFFATGVALAFVVLLLVDLWALLGWREATRAEVRDARGRPVARPAPEPASLRRAA